MRFERSMSEPHGFLSPEFIDVFNGSTSMRTRPYRTTTAKATSVFVDTKTKKFGTNSSSPSRQSEGTSSMLPSKIVGQEVAHGRFVWILTVGSTRCKMPRPFPPQESFRSCCRRVVTHASLPECCCSRRVRDHDQTTVSLYERRSYLLQISREWISKPPAMLRIVQSMCLRKRTILRRREHALRVRVSSERCPSGSAQSRKQVFPKELR